MHSKNCGMRCFFASSPSPPLHCVTNQPLNDVKSASQISLNNNTFEECKKETLKSMRKHFCALSWGFNRNSTQDSTFTHTHTRHLIKPHSINSSVGGSSSRLDVHIIWLLFDSHHTLLRLKCQINAKITKTQMPCITRMWVRLGSLRFWVAPFFPQLSTSFASTFGGAALHFKWQNDELAQISQAQKKWWICIPTPLYGLFYNSCGRRIQWMHIHDGITSK